MVARGRHLSYSSAARNEDLGLAGDAGYWTRQRALGERRRYFEGRAHEIQDINMSLRSWIRRNVRVGFFTQDRPQQKKGGVPLGE